MKIKKNIFFRTWTKTNPWDIYRGASFSDVLYAPVVPGVISSVLLTFIIYIIFPKLDKSYLIIIGIILFFLSSQIIYRINSKRLTNKKI
ncbi:MAG: hypothetical protein WCW00_00345 [Candidatus Paceibacterota bacterium]